MDRPRFKRHAQPPSRHDALQARVDKAERELGVGILLLYTSELPRAHSLPIDVDALLSKRAHYIEERMEQRFGPDHFGTPSRFDDMARAEGPSLWCNGDARASGESPFNCHYVQAVPTQAVIFIEDHTYSTAQDLSSSFRLHANQVHPAPGISVQELSLDHELGHLMLRLILGSQFTRKHDELGADFNMLANKPAATARYGRDWRLLSNMFSTVEETNMPYYNSLSFVQKDGPVKPAHELAATLEVKNALYQLVAGQSHVLPSAAMMAPHDYYQTCLEKDQGAPLRLFYSKDMPPNQTTEMARATQSLPQVKNLSPLAANLARMTRAAAQRRIKLVA